MSRTILFYADTKDIEALSQYAASIGLNQVGMQIDKPVSPDPADGSHCYLSPVPVAQLHPFGDPPVRLTDVRDPLLLFGRGYFRDGYLVIGRIVSNTDDSELARQTRSYFEKLSRWIRSNWPKTEGSGVSTGPVALERINAGAERVNFMPGTVTGSTVVVGVNISPDTSS